MAKPTQTLALTDDEIKVILQDAIDQNKAYLSSSWDASPRAMMMCVLSEAVLRLMKR